MSLANAPPDSDLEFDLDSVIRSFLTAFPDPEDKQVHGFAALIGLDYADFEERMFSMFGAELDEDDLIEITENADPVDEFIIHYFLHNATPTEEQIHSLAAIVGMEPEEFEEHIYSMMSDLELEDDTTK